MSLFRTRNCLVATKREIQSATKNLDDDLVIGQGGFGKVYKGRFSDEEGGHVIAVKRLDSMSNQGETEFKAEIDMLSKLRHCHLVSLIGYCDENKEMILVYDFMPNGTLYHHLHKANTPLTWMTRLKIAIGAARGLDYLHTGVGTEHGVIHRDVKSSNILLDEKWAAMISDFGLSRIGPTNQLVSYIDASVKGTFGYLDPEYFYTRKLTRKTDVYAFGVVLFELLSGRLPVDDRNGEDYCSLVRWAQKCVKERKLDHMVDSSIKGTIFPKCLRRFAQIAYRCVHPVPKERPTMTEVVASLHACLGLQEKPNHSSKLLGILGFSWNVHKSSDPATTPNSDLELPSESLLSQIRTPSTPAKPDSVRELLVHQSTSSGENPLARRPTAVKPDKLEYKVNFQDLLFSGDLVRLELVTKVKILVGIAQEIVRLQKPDLNNTWRKVRESELERRKILLDEDFTVKLSWYDTGHYKFIIDNGCFVLGWNLSGYKVIFLEVLTGERIYSPFRPAGIDLIFTERGKKSLDRIAELCYEMCNEVDSESKMLTMLKEHDELIRKYIFR